MLRMFCVDVEDLQQQWRFKRTAYLNAMPAAIPCFTVYQRYGTFLEKSCLRDIRGQRRARSVCVYACAQTHQGIRCPPAGSINTKGYIDEHQRNVIRQGDEPGGQGLCCSHTPKKHLFSRFHPNDNFRESLFSHITYKRSQNDTLRRKILWKCLDLLLVIILTNSQIRC